MSDLTTSKSKLDQQKIPEKNFGEILRHLIRINQNSSKRLRISIEGNIASGKTTVIRYLKDAVEYSNRKQEKEFGGHKYHEYNLDESKEINLTDTNTLFNKRVSVKLIPEPVDKWRNLNGVNLLELMYKDPQRWSGTFHSYVQLTMFENHVKINEPLATNATENAVLSPKKFKSSHSQTTPITSPNKNKDALRMDIENQSPVPTISPSKVCPNSGVEDTYSINIMERSLYSANYCFVENIFRAEIMKPQEYDIYQKWFDFMTEAHDCTLDVIFYLRTNPKTCLDRLNKRGRPEETSTINLAYLQKLNDLHEEWLNPESVVRPLDAARKLYKAPTVIIIDADQSVEEVYRSMEVETHRVLAMRN